MWPTLMPLASGSSYNVSPESVSSTAIWPSPLHPTDSRLPSLETDKYRGQFPTAIRRRKVSEMRSISATSPDATKPTKAFSPLGVIAIPQGSKPTSIVGQIFQRLVFDG